MGQHRTRKEKEKIAITRMKDVEPSESQPQSSNSYSYSSETRPDARPQSSTTLLKVDQKYIIKDLIKTVSISSLLLLVVIGIYFYLRYN